MKLKTESGPKSVTQHMQSVDAGGNNTTESLLHRKHSSNSKGTKLVGKYYKSIEVQ